MLPLMLTVNRFSISTNANTVNGAYFIKSKLAKIVTLNMNFEEIVTWKPF